jgi:gluconokinase
MVIVLLGVSGSGKTTVGLVLARDLGWRFVDADDLHPRANIEKMTRNEPLTDADREPWLHALRSHMESASAANEQLVVACSALKRRYRHTLADGLPGVHFVYLKATPAQLEQRLQRRRGHFAGPGLVASQLATLEEPTADEALIVDATEPPDTLSAHIRAALHC